MKQRSLFWAGIMGMVLSCATPALTQQSLPVNPPPGEFGVREKGVPGAAESWGAQLRRQEPFHRAEQAAIANGDHRRAEAICLKAVAADTEDPQSWLLLAQVSERLGKPGQALKAYRALVYAKGWGSNINSDPTTLMRYVLALSKTGRWQEAVSIYERADQQVRFGVGKPLVDLQPTASSPNWSALKAAAHYVLGTRRPSFGPADPAEQLDHLKAAATFQPKWALAQLAYGKALAKAGRTADAKAAYARAAANTGGNGELVRQIEEARKRLEALGSVR